MSELPIGLGEVALPELPLFRRGKVRDTFDLGDRLLMVSTDRISAFDCVLGELIPDRGKVLTAMSRYWFAETEEIIANHLGPDDPGAIPESAYRALEGRMMFVAKAERIDIECVVRARLAGSGWLEYQERGTLAGEAVPSGLEFGARLAEPRFTPATKNDHGHDQNISRAELSQQLGPELAGRLEETSLAIFGLAEERCLAAGFVLVDTKFEFGLVEGQLTLIDELLTPDSSRLWEEGRELGADPNGFDKQLVRDFLIASGWDQRPPAPTLPPQLIEEVRARYLEACRRITGSVL